MILRGLQFFNVKNLITRKLYNSCRLVIPKVAQQCRHRVPLQRTVLLEVEVVFVVDHGHVSLSQVQRIEQTIMQQHNSKYVRKKIMHNT